MAPATTTSVQVALRIRPITPQDAVSIPARFQRIVIHGSSDTSVSVDAVASTPSGGTPGATAAPPTAVNKKQAFTFDQVHDPETGQFQVYKSTAEPLIARFLEGFNCTILAYGQTSSGKTHTMTGVDLDGDPTDPENGMGIVPRSIAEIFARVNETKKDKRGAWNATVKGSFIEIYNEDLIDLLSTDDPSARREVQIREDKDGHIIWGGLREVPVRNVGEVMNLIRQGTSIRRTNETQMNAQSSRSHAIFSLTLTQKRYTGSGPPPRPSSPGPMHASSSRITRPGSLYTTSGSSNRVGSPTFGRPPTPSFQSAMNRGSQALRPHSSLGHSEDDRLAQAVPSVGEWSTIVSKFHFVDLAGSERLKRTAAAGERIKEGISINSGLLALGNVISALGDPLKAKTTTHVPYRDSKLTRLLQDSLGGNAHTLMIACVSPVEWNVGETVNTLKYANRARNIRNRVRIDEREEGWDDVEWLQSTVIRLRKDLKALREGGTVPPSDSAYSDLPGDEPVSHAAKQVRDQLADLQSQYVELRQKFTDRTEELTRLRRQAGESIRKSGGSIAAGTSRYEEIVGPVIEEYEKTITAMEAELSLNRAALRHTNDLLTEKEDELATEVERHTVTEAYVEELRVRVSKLLEREASTEAYIQDLEEKIKLVSSSSNSASDSLTIIQKELARYKESEATNTSYIANLEARLAKSEESVLELRAAVEHAEKTAEGRAEEVKELEQKLVHMRGDEKGWRSDLEIREDKVRDLEAKMKEWVSRKDEAARERERLGDLVLGVEDAKKSWDDISKSSTPKEPSPTSTLSVNGQTGLDAQLQGQLRDLQETHTATLADLSNVTDKYRDALREISDLAAQLQEAKLQHPIHSTATSASDPAETLDMNSSPSFTRRRKPSVTRRSSNDSNSDHVYAGVNGASRRPFFRQAASTESLPARSPPQSLSLSQELFSARSLPRSIGSHSLRHQRSESLITQSHVLHPGLSLSLPLSAGISGQVDRTVFSLEQEIMRLQEVLKDREAEISQLERTMHDGKASELGTALSEPFDSQKLSPHTLDHFSALRTSIIHELPDDEAESGSSSKRPSLGRLDELMRSMAQKESQHREVVEGLTSELKQIRRQHDDLTTLSRDQALNMSNELDALQKSHDELLVDLNALRERDSQLTNSIKVAEQRHAEELEVLRQQHIQLISEKQAELDELVSSKQKGEEAQIQLAESKAELAKLQDVHDTALAHLGSRHKEELVQLIDSAESEKARVHAEHTTALAKLNENFGVQLSRVQSDANETQKRTDEEYYLALSKLRSQHTEEIRSREEKAALDLKRLRDDLEGRIRQVDIVQQGALVESEASQAEVIKRLQEEHDATLARKQDEFAGDLQRAKEAHSRSIKENDIEHGQVLAKCQSEHASTLSTLEEEHSKTVSKLNQLLSTTELDHKAAMASLKEESDRLCQAAKEEKDSALKDLESIHEEAICKLKEEHGVQIRDLVVSHENQTAQLQQAHVKDIARMKAEHQSNMSELNNSLIAHDEEHRRNIEDLRKQHLKLLSDEREGHTRGLSELEEVHRNDQDQWQKRQNAFLDEIASLKSLLTDSRAEHRDATTAHLNSMQEKLAVVESLEKELSDRQRQHDDMLSQIDSLTAEKERAHNENTQLTHDITKHALAAEELGTLRAELHTMKLELQSTKEQSEGLAAEKNRNEATIRELQAQLANSSTSKNLNTALPDLSSRPIIERTISYPRGNGLPPAKLPPLSPPPSIPPPPLPTALPNETGHASVSSVASTHGRHSSGSQETHDTLPTPTTSVNGSAHPEDALLAKLQAQTRLMEEQEAMIKTLNKQLTHCEGDLQAHIDLVSTLETSLNDSERNLRKARNQANELSRDRDQLNKQLEAARDETRASQRELATARQSVIEQKQSLEHRLDEERKAKERTRAQLDARMEEMQRRKSKFACM